MWKSLTPLHIALLHPFGLHNACTHEWPGFNFLTVSCIKDSVWVFILSYINVIIYKITYNCCMIFKCCYSSRPIFPLKLFTFLTFEIKVEKEFDKEQVLAQRSWFVSLDSGTSPVRLRAAHPCTTLRAQDWSRLRIQSLLYRSQGPLGRTTLGRRYFFPPTL